MGSFDARIETLQGAAPDLGDRSTERLTMLRALLLCFVIFACLGVFLIGPHSALAVEQSPEEGNQPTPVDK